MAAAADANHITTPGPYTVTVPSAVCAVTVTARGGAGGSVVTRVTNTNGAGAQITVTYAVAPGQTFSGTVGAGGKPSTGSSGQAGNGGPIAGLGGAGVGAGGSGGTVGSGSSHAGAGGGGGTLVQLGGVALIYAGGGGGSSGGHATNGGFGGNAGLPSAAGTVAAGTDGLDGFDNPNQGTGSGVPGGGKGGQAAAGGAGGLHTTVGGLSGSAGSGSLGNGLGGSGGPDPNFDSGGAGGGGYTGGGGGASTTLNGSGTAVAGGNAGGGGGGGSSLVTTAGSPASVSSAAGPRLGSSHNGAGADGLVSFEWVSCIPTAPDFETVDRPNVPQSVDPLDPDEGAQPGDPSVPIVASSLVLVGADPDGTVTVDGGVYSIEGGKIVFTPELNYFGTPDPVEYQVADSNGTTATGSYQPKVIADAPETDDGVTSGPQGVLQTWTPAPTPGQDFAIDPASFTLLDADGLPVAEIVKDGVGSYRFVNGVIHFQPVPTFVGDAPTVDYRVSDVVGQHAKGTYTPSVTAVKPTAPDFETTDRPNVSQSVDPLDPVKGAKPGDPEVPLVPGSLKLVGAAPDGTVTVDEGVYSLVEGRIVFTPKADYFGPVTPVEYQVADTNGTTAKGKYQPNIEVEPPETDNGETTGLQGVLQTWTPSPVAGQDFPIADGSLTLLDDEGDPVDEIVVAGVGTYTVVGEEIHFQPVPTFVGAAPTVDYRVSDVAGQHAKGTYTPKVTAVEPIANDDTTTGRPNQVQSVNPLLNDEPGDPGVPLDPSSLELLDPVTGDPVSEVEVPEGIYTLEEGRIVFTPKENYFGPVTPVEYQVADVNGTTAKAEYQPVIEVERPTTDSGETTGPQGVPQSWTPTPVPGQDFAIDPASLTLLDDEGAPVEKIVVAGKGAYTVAGGKLVFTPEPSFIGKAPTVDYRITDVGGQHAKGTYTPTVVAVTPVATDDASSGWWNVPQSVDPLANDEAGDPAVPLDPSSLTLLDGDGDPAESVTVPEGVYTIDRTNPEQPRIVFTPNRDFTGTPTPVDYRISDVNGTPAEAIYRPSVRGPQDSQDLEQTKVCGSTVTFDTVSEVPGLDAGSVRLRDAEGNSVLELVVDGEGTWKVDPDTGKVTFTPEGCLDEDPTPVNWEGTLTDGTPIFGTLTVFYTEPEDTPDEELPYTGANPLLPAGIAALLLTAGLVLVGIRRRGGLIS